MVDVDGKCAVRITRLLATTVADLESHSLSKNELISPMPATQNQHQFVEFGEDNELERYRAKNQDENFDDDYNENDDYDYNDENEKNN